jgi:hypothetical protein
MQVNSYRTSCWKFWINTCPISAMCAVSVGALSIGRTTMKPKTPEPLYQIYIPAEDRGKVVASKYYRVNQNMDGLGHSMHPYNIECNLRIDFGLDGGIYKVEWTNRVLGEKP